MRNVTLVEDMVISKMMIHPHSNKGREMKKHVSLSDDVIELNIGGQKMTTLRSTLTAVPKSKLALMFSKDNPNTILSVDKQGAVFFDYNPIYFNYLLDQLRTIKRMPKTSGYQLQFSSPFISTQLNFTHMLIDLGLTRKLYIILFISKKNKIEAVQDLEIDLIYFSPAAVRRNIKSNSIECSFYSFTINRTSALSFS